MDGRESGPPLQTPRLLGLPLPFQTTHDSVDQSSWMKKGAYTQCPILPSRPTHVFIAKTFLETRNNVCLHSLTLYHAPV